MYSSLFPVGKIGSYNAMVLFHGVSCHLFPQTYLDQVTNVGDSKVYKRQADDDEDMLVQCALDRFNAFYQGNNSNFVSQCIGLYSSLGLILCLQQPLTTSVRFAFLTVAM